MFFVVIDEVYELSIAFLIVKLIFNIDPVKKAEIMRE